MITGVSAGALLALYAFLGPEWDKQLTDAYTSGRVAASADRSEGVAGKSVECPADDDFIRRFASESAAVSLR